MAVIMRASFVLLCFCSISVYVTCFENTLRAKDNYRSELKHWKLSNTLTISGVNAREDGGDLIDGRKPSNALKISEVDTHEDEGDFTDGQIYFFFAKSLFKQRVKC